MSSKLMFAILAGLWALVDGKETIEHYPHADRSINPNFYYNSRLSEQLIISGATDVSLASR